MNPRKRLRPDAVPTMTPAKANILMAIYELTKSSNERTTLMDVEAATGKSKITIHEHVSNLRIMGMLVKVDKYQSRGISITQKGRRFAQERIEGERSCKSLTDKKWDGITLPLEGEVT